MANDVNLFKPIVVLITAINTSLSETNPLSDSKEPRWVRVARAKKYQTKAIGGAVVNVTKLFCGVMFKLQQLCMDLEDLVNQIDSGVALSEAAIEFLKQAPAAINSLSQELAKANLGISIPAIPDTSSLTTLQNVLNIIPSPEDFKVISKELYKLFAIAYNATTGLVDLTATGKIRLLQWAMSYSITDLKYGAVNPTSPAITYLGVRKDFALTDTTTALPANIETTSKEIVVYDKTIALTDIAEATAILTALGYTGATALSSFQIANGIIGESNKIGVKTLHRLMHLDYDNSVTKRAIPKTV